jgi:hypothetical protein
MHKYIILFFSVTLIWCGCKSDSVPGKYIQPKEMAGLLVQVHLVDGSLYAGVQVPDSLYKFGMGKYLAAFKNAGTDSATFRKSMTYYTSEPEKLLAVYDLVDARMKVINDSINQIQVKKNTQIRKVDSLKADSVRKVAIKGLKTTPKKDSVKKADMKGLKTMPKADSIKQRATKHKLAVKADSLRKLKIRRRPNAVPIK